MEGDVLVYNRFSAVFAFQSTPSAWRETETGAVSPIDTIISIHSLRMEGDYIADIHDFFLSTFQSTPSAWRETKFNEKFPADKIFQSTPSAWRETREFLLSYSQYCHFNPLPPHGGRPLIAISLHTPFVISIHSLRMEGDHSTEKTSCPAFSFQSTPSAWRETKVLFVEFVSLKHFNPLPPHGGRLQLCYNIYRG